MNVVIVQAQNTTNKAEKDEILFEKFNSSTVIESTIETLLKLDKCKVVILYSEGNKDILNLKSIKNNNIESFLHEEEGYLEAFRRIVNKFNSEYMIRVNGCNCLTDTSIIESTIEHMIEKNIDYIFFENYPIGIAPSEIISKKIINKENIDESEDFKVNNISIRLKNRKNDIDICSIKAKEQFAEFMALDLSAQYLNIEYIEKMYKIGNSVFFNNENRKDMMMMNSKIYQFINKYNNMVQSNNEGKVFGVLLTPWAEGATDVAEFSIMVAYLLNIKKSVKIKFIIDDIVFGQEKLHKKRIEEIKEIIKYCSEYFEVYMVSDYLFEIEASKFDKQEIEKISEYNAIWINKGENFDELGNEFKDAIYSQLKKSDQYIRGFIKKEKFDCLFVPGGMYGNSSLWYKECKKNNLRIVTYDSGFEIIMICDNDIASQQRDLTTALSMMHEVDEAKLLKVINRDINNKIVGIDRDAYLKGYDKNINSIENYVVIYLNLSWDTAAIGIHNCFNNSIEWVEETTKWLLENSNLNIVIRQHPVEAIDEFCSKDNYKKLILDKFGRNSRINFISAKDKINSYKLLDNAEFVIVTSTTIGLESVIKGKIVITESNSYYGIAGAVYKANTLEEYYNLLKKATNKYLTITEKQYNDALKLYYLSKCCIAYTRFNPAYTCYQNIDYLNDKIVDIIIESIYTGKPLAYLIHLHLERQGVFDD